MYTFTKLRDSRITSAGRSLRAVSHYGIVSVSATVAVSSSQSVAGRHSTIM